VQKAYRLDGIHGAVRLDGIRGGLSDEALETFVQSFPFERM